MQIDFTPQGQAEKRGRYVRAKGASVQVGDPESPEYTGVGVMPGKPNIKPVLVHEHGAVQTFVPLYAASAAVASGKVIPFDALVGAFVFSGTLDKLKAAIEKHEGAVKAAAAKVGS